jgi:8-oxo-dGTP diphosphatase
VSTGTTHGYLEARDFDYCPWCGSRLAGRKIDGRDRLSCSNCEFIWYKNPVPAAGAIIHADGDILLVKRKYPPAAGDWCFPAGFQENDESPVDCCIREVREETGLDIRIESLFWNYRAGDDPRTMVVLMLYLARVVGGTMKAGDDALEAGFFGIDSVPDNIAFSAHRRAIAHFKEYLRRGAFPHDSQ